MDGWINGWIFYLHLSLTHLAELLVGQLQPGHVQVVQVVAAVAGWRHGGRRLLAVAEGTAGRLGQQPGGDTHRHTRCLTTTEEKVENREEKFMKHVEIRKKPYDMTSW